MFKLLLVFMCFFLVTGCTIDLSTDDKDVKDPVVESKDNLDDDTKLELQDNIHTFIKYFATEKEVLLTKFTPNEIYDLISKLQKNFVSLEYLFQNKK